MECPQNNHIHGTSCPPSPRCWANFNKIDVGPNTITVNSHITNFSGDGAKIPDAEVPDAEVPDAEVPDAEVPDGADEVFPMGVKTYFIRAKPKGSVFFDTKTKDKLDGDFNYYGLVVLPCGCRTYIGEIQRQQEEKWDFEISPETNFEFNLCCENHNEEIIVSGNAMICQDILGWGYVIPTK
jgi:hypothetical protein